MARGKRSGNKSNSGSSREQVGREVARLYKKNPRRISHSDLAALRGKFGDERILDAIYNGYIDNQRRVRNNAKKFARGILEKYGMARFPTSQLLRRASAQRHKLNLSDAEFAEFRRIYEQIVSGRGEVSQDGAPRTNLSRALGNVSLEYTDGMNVDDREYGTLQRVLRMYSESRHLHAQVVLQNMSWKECATEASQGRYDPTRHNRMCAIHPVVAALFLPSIQLVNDTMLNASVAHIVKTRYNREPLLNRPDYELFYDMVTDPNDVVCDRASPMKDLHDRAELQRQLWRAVLHLREGKFYECSSAALLQAIDNCRVTRHDSPNLQMNSDEITIMRRLMAAFSMRPTLVQVSPVVQIASSRSPYVPSLVSPRVTRVPALGVRLPYGSNTGGSTTLNDALASTAWFLENGVIVPKQQQVIHSRGILVINVNRRMQTVQLSTNVLNVHNFQSLPGHVTGFDRYNDASITVNRGLKVGDDIFTLKSVVCVTTMQTRPVQGQKEQTIINGSETYVMCGAGKAGRSETWLYNPRLAASSPGPMTPLSRVTRPPIGVKASLTGIGPLGPPGAESPPVRRHDESNQSDIETHGTVFVYTTDADQSRPLVRAVPFGSGL